MPPAGKLPGPAIDPRPVRADSPGLTRRRFLAGAAAGVTTAFPGCGGDSSPAPPETPETDVGTDAYGIVVESLLTDREPVTVQVKEPFGEALLWERSVTLEPEGRGSWSDVVTGDGDGERVVVARFGGPDGIPADYVDGSLEGEFRRDRLWVTPGSPSAPDIEDFRVVVRPVEIQSGYTIKTISITYPGGPPTATPCNEFGCG